MVTCEINKNVMQTFWPPSTFRGWTWKCSKHSKTFVQHFYFTCNHRRRDGQVDHQVGQVRVGDLQPSLYDPSFRITVFTKCPACFLFFRHIQTSHRYEMYSAYLCSVAQLLYTLGFCSLLPCDLLTCVGLIRPTCPLFASFTTYTGRTWWLGRPRSMSNSIFWSLINKA